MFLFESFLKILRLNSSLLRFVSRKFYYNLCCHIIIPTIPTNSLSPVSISHKVKIFKYLFIWHFVNIKDRWPYQLFPVCFLWKNPVLNLKSYSNSNLIFKRFFTSYQIRPSRNWFYLGTCILINRKYCSQNEIRQSIKTWQNWYRHLEGYM